MRQGDATWKAVVVEMTGIIRDRARLKKTISYSELSALVKTAVVPYDSPSIMGGLLADVSIAEDAAGRGMLSVLVVHKTGDMMPGWGFFELAEQLGRDISDPDACWANEMKRVFASNAAHAPISRRR